MRYELSDYEWATIRPFLPSKPRCVPRVDDRRVLNGIFWILRSGAPWRDLPESFGPYTTCLQLLSAFIAASASARVL
jgi:transposase